MGTERITKWAPASITVTFQPQDAAAEASSSPMNPPPTIINRWRRRMTSARLFASAAERGYRMSLGPTSRSAQPPRFGPDRQQEAPIRDAAAVLEKNLPLRPIDRNRAGSGVQLDLVPREKRRFE